MSYLEMEGFVRSRFPAPVQYAPLARLTWIFRRFARLTRLRSRS